MRYRRVLAGLGIATAAMPVLAAAPAGPAVQSVQQLFDAAATATDTGDREGALANYALIEQRIGSRGGSSLAITRARKGVLLMDLGRYEEAGPALRYARDRLDPASAALKGDRYMVDWSLGRLEELSFDYPAARKAYAAAEAEAADNASRRAIWAAQARVTMFENPAAALVLIDRALADIGTAPADKTLRAHYRTVRGRVLLNARDYRGAQAELQKAMGELGGLTLRLDLSDVAARSDLAIAAMLAGDKELARKYLAYTGAGTMKDVLTPGASALPPPCGGEADLRPDDVAVVEFNVREDGSVIGAVPIYASRNGPVAVGFARTVADWSWTREEVARIKPFFRALIRVELRCSVAADRPGIADLLEPRINGWEQGRGIAGYDPDGSPAVWLPRAEAELLRRQGSAGVASPALIPVLRAIADNPTATKERRLEAVQRALAIAEAEKAPPAALALLSYQEIELRRDWRSGQSIRKTADALNGLSEQPAIAADPVVRAAVRLWQADALIAARRDRDALPILQRIADDGAIETRDPMKVGALLRLATIKAQDGALEAARADYARSGLTAQSCALVDAKPAMVSSNSGSAQFPAEAMRWGFEGWATTEFDIAADGRTANVRSLIAYPPFVFSPASVSVVSGARFTQSYRPEGGLGCGGLQQRIRFTMPGGK